MKILLVTEQFPPLIGGAANYFFNLFRHFPAQDVIVYTRKRRGADEFDKKQDMKIIRRWIWNTSLWPPHITSLFGPVCLLLDLTRIMMKEKVDIIHCGSVHPFAGYGFFFKIFFGIPYVVYTFAEEIMMLQRNAFKRRVISFLLQRADAVAAISNFTKREVVKLGVAQEKVSIVTAGVDTLHFCPSDASGLRERLGLQGKKVILTLARLGDRKNHETVIRSLPQVIAKVQNSIYLIVGSGSTEHRLKALVRDLKLEEYVRFIPEVPHELTPEYYNLADVFVMPNRRIDETGDVEGFNLVFLEASACGKPVIGGRSGGAEEAIRDGQTGILLNDATDPKEVSEAILALLLDEDLSRRMGSVGRKYAEDFFAWEGLSNKIAKLNERIIKD